MAPARIRDVVRVILPLRPCAVDTGDPVLLTYLVELLAILLTTTLALHVGHRLAGRSPALALIVFAAGGGLLTLFLVGPRFLPGLYALPHPVPITPNLILAASLVYVGAAARRVWHRRVGRVLLLGQSIPLAYVVLGSPLLLIVSGHRFAALTGIRGEAHYLQTSPQTCAASCAQTVLGIHGVRLSEGEMAVHCRTTALGTRMFRLMPAIVAAGAARGATLSCELRTTLEPAQLLELRAPAILVLRNHVVVLRGRLPGGRLWIADPARPRTLRLTPTQLTQAYPWAGLAVIVRRLDR